MLSNDAEARLKEFNDTAFPKEMITITDRVRIAVGWGHSNCIIVEGDTSLILVDTLDSDARAARLKDELSRLTDKPVKTIIFTHGHPDHRGGCGSVPGHGGGDHRLRAQEGRIKRDRTN